MSETTISKLKNLELELSLRATASTVHELSQVRTMIIGVLTLAKRVEEKKLIELVKEIEKKLNTKIL